MELALASAIGVLTALAIYLLLRAQLRCDPGDDLPVVCDQPADLRRWARA